MEAELEQIIFILHRWISMCLCLTHYFYLEVKCNRENKLLFDFTSFFLFSNFFYFSTEEDSEVQGAAATTSENEVENDDDEENETITRFDENQLPPIDLGKKHALKKYARFT